MMQNPFAPQPESNSYINLKERILQQVRSARVNDRIFKVVQNAYEEALAQENIILSRPERKRLLAQVLKQVLADMLKKLDERTNG
jgi:uncharacterized membrane protein YheB (UPF0754 family)